MSTKLKINIMISKNTIDKVRDLDVKDVLESFGLNLTRRGASYECCCPFHGEKTPSFKVNPARNIWKCFSCLKGGDAIRFVEEKENMTFSEAVEAIAQRNGVPIEYDKEPSEEERQDRQRRDDLRAAVATVQGFFVAEFNKDTPEAAAAREYAFGRWGEEFCREAGIGYAPKGSKAFMDYGRQAGIETALRELGYIDTDKSSGRDYALFRDRVTIPVNDRFGRTVAFTARDISGKSKAKYINSKTSELYQKEEMLFGIDLAARAAREKKHFIVVEGAPDVMRMQMVGLHQAVAPLGTALTHVHLEAMKKVCSVIRFIPDSDPKKGKLYGTGVATVMKNGRMAIEEGFDVSVREIPRTEEDEENETKHDPDSYITSFQVYAQMDDVPFVVWYARKRFEGADSQSLQMEVVQEVAAMLVHIEDELTRDMNIDMLCKLYGKAKIWRDAVKKESRKIKEAELAPDDAPKGMPPHIFASLRRCGFIVKNGSYYADDGGELVRCSNFMFDPVLHIKHKTRSTRIYRLKNSHDEEEVVEFASSDLVTLRDFNRKLFDRGNYSWRGDAKTLTAIQEHLLEVTPSASFIEVLGWDPKGEFYAYSNGIIADGEFKAIDRLGVVANGRKQYYLPAFSDIHAENELGYSFERLYRFNPQGATTLHDFLGSIAKVYGPGGMVSAAWMMTCVYRDIIFDKFRYFPVLNLFGRKGSGKTELARALSSLFYVLPSSPNSCSNTSIPVIGYNLSHSRNSLYILDEYTNDLMPQRIDLLKGLWGGNARSKMEDGIPITIPVLSGVILAGQYRPEDEAIFSRCIHLMYSQTVFGREETRNYHELMDMVLHGNTHLLPQLLRLRDVFAKGFFQAFDMTLNDVLTKLDKEQMDTRVLNNWITVLAAFRVLEPHIDAPFTYNELFEIVVSGVRYQNEQISKSSDTANFWLYLDSMHTQGKVREKCHYIIKTLSSFTPAKKEKKERKDFISPKKVIFLNFKAVRGLLEQRIAKQKTGSTLDVATLESYLKSLPQFLGIKQQRFQILRPNGELETEIQVEAGISRKYVYANPSQALCFDYDSLRNALDLNLGTFRVTDEELNEDDDTAEKPKQPEQPSIFAPKEEDDPFND